MYKRIIQVLMVVFALVGMTFSVSADPVVGPIAPANSIIGLEASDGLGFHYALLPSGNLVVVADGWNDNRGLAACYTPEEYKAGGLVISAEHGLTGSTSLDYVGSGGITVLPNGDYLILSPEWTNGSSAGAGAVTWVDGETCIPFGGTTRGAVVSASNSLVGTSANDGTSLRVSVLSDGDYVVRWQYWDNVGATDAGAVTWANGQTGRVGIVTTTNSLVGTVSNSRISSGGVFALNNGHYVVTSPLWDTSIATNVGSVTWGNGDGSTVGAVSETNSLVGSTASDGIGTNLIVLNNGNYVTYSKVWDNGASTNAGAVTWGNGNGGTAGVVSETNSLVGSNSDDQIGSYVVGLTNGNYVTSSGTWDNAAVNNAGAATWGNGLTGITGAVTAANSFVGSANDAVGSYGVTALTNGNYVIVSEFGSSTPNHVGAVTLGNGTTGLTGLLSASNSLTGSTTLDLVGNTGIIVLPDGNYVVRSEDWDNGAASDVGAVTWCSGVTGCAGGVVSIGNSLVGSTSDDSVGASGVNVLPSGDYVVRSINWDNGAAVNAGAVTWASKDGSTVGAISASNSLVGTIGANRVGEGGIRTLTNGHYVVISYSWDDGVSTDLGAITWCPATSPCVGAVSPTNSLVGAISGSLLSVVVSLKNGHYVVIDAGYDDGINTDVGMVVWANGEDGSTVGVFGANNVVLKGDKTNDIVGLGNRLVLNNGDYLIGSERWVNGGATWAGALTMLKGDGTAVGVVGSANSLVGTSTNDSVGKYGIIELPDGGFLSFNQFWDNAGLTNVGAVTYSEGFVSPNRLTNGGFETAGATPKLANGWTVMNRKPADKRVCDTDLKPITTTEGDCVFQFSVSVTPESGRTLKQILTGDNLGDAGDSLSLSAMVEGNKLKTGGKIIVTATYADLTTVKFVVPLGSGTFAFTEKTGAVTLTQDVTKVVVNIKMAKVTGRVRLDDMQLIVTSAARLAFPLLNTTRDGAVEEAPVVPEGFRQ